MSNPADVSDPAWVSDPADPRPARPAATESPSEPPAAGDPPHSRAPRPPLRVAWVRPLALLILVFVMPLDWTRTEASGCGAPTDVRIQTGYEHLFVRSDVGGLIIALAVMSLILLWGAYRNPTWRVFFSGAALLINLMLAGLVVLGATFQLFSKVVVLPAGWVAFVSCGALVAEPLVRFSAHVVVAFKQFRQRRRDKRRAASPGPRPP